MCIRDRVLEWVWKPESGAMRVLGPSCNKRKQYVTLSGTGEGLWRTSEATWGDLKVTWGDLKATWEGPRGSWLVHGELSVNFAVSQARISLIFATPLT